MDILLSIKPEYSDKIFSGNKKVEFRKHKPRFKFESAFIYETVPIRRITGWFTVNEIIQGSPEELWAKYKDISGIEKSDYLDYCKNKEIIYAFIIGNVHRFVDPIYTQVFMGFKAPQDFRYIPEEIGKEWIKYDRIQSEIYKETKEW